VPQTAQQPTRLVLQQVVPAAQHGLGKPWGHEVSPLGHVVFFFFFFLFFFLARALSLRSAALVTVAVARSLLNN
jgi:hypothetical protein